jgi:hypothetical protein
MKEEHMPLIHRKRMGETAKDALVGIAVLVVIGLAIYGYMLSIKKKSNVGVGVNSSRSSQQGFVSNSRDLRYRIDPISGSVFQGEFSNNCLIAERMFGQAQQVQGDDGYLYWCAKNIQPIRVARDATAAQEKMRQAQDRIRQASDEIKRISGLIEAMEFGGGPNVRNDPQYKALQIELDKANQAWHRAVDDFWR